MAPPHALWLLAMAAVPWTPGVAGSGTGGYSGLHEQF